MSFKTPSYRFMNISAAPLVCILLVLVIIDSTHASTVAESVFTSLFLSSHFNANLTPFIRVFNSATFMGLAYETNLITGGCPHGVKLKARDCEIVASEFKLRSRYYNHFQTNTLGKGMNPLIFPVMG